MLSLGSHGCVLIFSSCGCGLGWVWGPGVRTGIHSIRQWRQLCCVLFSYRRASCNGRDFAGVNVASIRSLRSCRLNAPSVHGRGGAQWGTEHGGRGR